MRCKVVGSRNSSFTPQGEDKPIEGINLYVVYQDEKVTGFATDRLFVLPKKFVNGVVPRVDEEIDVTYNRYGKVDSVTVL